MANNLVVITFENETDARSMLASIREIEKQGQISIEDTAVLVKDQHGKLKVQNEVSGATETGAVVGGMVGLMLAFLFPVTGIVMGIAGGALVGKVLDTGVEGRFVKDLGEELKPGTSALFIVSHGSNHAAVRAVIEPYKGTLYQTNLSDELETELRHVLQ